MATLTKRPNDLDRARESQRERERALQRVKTALEEQERRGRQYEGAVGTSLELQAYVRLREARMMLSARERWLEWVDDDSYVPATRGEDASREALDEIAGH
jgi:hypothetical protein